MAHSSTAALAVKAHTLGGHSCGFAAEPRWVGGQLSLPHCFRRRGRTCRWCFGLRRSLFNRRKGGNCSYFGGWRHQIQVRLADGFWPRYQID
jgi:hypothetical protein